MKGSASRQVVFALVVAFAIMALSGGKWTQRINKIADVNVAERKS
jgi:hypothetical protein